MGDLLLMWRHYPVGEIVRSGDTVSFRYLRDTDEYRAARSELFAGYPGFPCDTDVGVLKTLMRRLPERGTRRYREYLESAHVEDSDDDMEILERTMAKLPGDEFWLLSRQSYRWMIGLVIRYAGPPRRRNNATTSAKYVSAH